MASFFRDPDGGALTYTVASSAPGVVSVSISVSTLTMVGVADGTGAVTVTARDPDGLTAAQAFSVTVETPNRAPEAVGTIPNQTVDAGGTATLDASAHFTDPDGDALAYAASSSDPAVATASASGSTVTIHAAARGTAAITVTASDPAGLTATHAATVTVENPDRATLVALYEATNGPNWTRSNNWLTDAPLGEWYGVETDRSGRVVRLDLSGEYDESARQWVPHGLSGPIPPERFPVPMPRG